MLMNGIYLTLYVHAYKLDNYFHIGVFRNRLLKCVILGRRLGIALFIIPIELLRNCIIFTYINHR